MTEAQKQVITHLREDMEFAGVEVEEDVYSDGSFIVEGRDKYDGSRWVCMVRTDGEVYWL